LSPGPTTASVKDKKGLIRYSGNLDYHNEGVPDLELQVYEGAILAQEETAKNSEILPNHVIERYDYK
jgi:hypothetical protein